MEATETYIRTTIETVTGFLTDLENDRQKAEKYLYDGNAFVRKSPLSLTAMCKIGLLSVKSQYAAEVPIALGNIVNGFGGAPVPVSKSAYCQRRQKIRPALFRDWARDIARNGVIGPRRWHGYIPAAFDGTTVQAPKMYDCPEEFGLWKNDAGDTVPLLKITLLCMLLDNIIMDIDVGGCDRNERPAAMSMTGSLTREHLLILDRGFPSYALFKVLLSRDIKFIIRVSPSFNSSVREFANSGERNGEVTFTFNKSTAKALINSNVDIPDRDPVKLRCIRFTTPAGTTEFLVTNLDAKDFPDRLVADGYMLRWRVEVDILFLKNEQMWEVMSGYKAVCVLQDIYSACVLFNIQTLYMNVCQRKLGQENDRRHAMHQSPLAISHSVALSLLMHFLTGTLAPDKANIRLAAIMVGVMVRTASAESHSQSRPRRMRLKRIVGKHWTETNYKDSLRF